MAVRLACAIKKESAGSANRSTSRLPRALKHGREAATSMEARLACAIKKASACCGLLGSVPNLIWMGESARDCRVTAAVAL